ncbi:MAG TPA: polyprenol monophosphomannose synthase [Candidatus Ozemobacteraceae bacterium]|nr:polyprenol monophosphomannose synthase [Candidatus Ozemobacteraceae bacterium]
MSESKLPANFSQRVVAFLPTYNEAGNIKKIIEALLDLGPTVSVLVIDDQSPDGTGDIVADIARTNPRVLLISRPPPRGRGLAGRDGFIWFQQHPEFDILVEMDADFSHHPSAIPSLIAGLDEADVVIGSRYIAGGGEVGRPSDRKWISSLANAYLRFVLRTRQRDCTSGFRVFKRSAFAGLDFSRFVSVGPPIVTELLFDLLRHRRRIVERPIIFADRVEGTSKLTTRILIDSLWFPLWLRLRRHLRSRAEN